MSMRIGLDPLIETITRPQPIQAIRIGADNTTNEERGTTPFSEILQITMTGSSDAARELSAVSRQGTVEALLGQVEDLAANVVASQKSGLQFELNLNIRNKVLDAYNEIMRMQV
jgi:flagellar hook-basal body complex protein FliE